MSPTHTDVDTRIRQLTPSVINKIAAGEVIERPASVVKELLENSVDALSSRIEVEIENGGVDCIRIVDDGEGIHPDDFELSVASHATSKIVDADDLFRVQTMGFRGEALASIAEVSQFQLRSRRRGADIGMELNVHGGILKEPHVCGCPEGTRIEVRQLFFNTPVRRKFLKTPATEFGHISEQFTRIALANPNLHLVLRHNDKIVYELPATHRLIERLELFYGSKLTEQLIWVESEHEGAHIRGYVAHPSQSKATRKGQYLFLNGRWIQDRSLQHALSEAYRGLVMVGRHPISFLFLEVDPNQVDVNVHPTKSEVRFQNSQILYRLLLSTLRNQFLSMDLDSRLDLPNQSGKAGAQASQSPVPAEELRNELSSWVQKELQPPPGRVLFSADNLNPAADQKAGALENRSSDEMLAANPSLEGQGVSAGLQDHSEEFSTDQPSATADQDEESSAIADDVRAMQVHDCYLVVETREGLTVIDQHALHERIMYEQLRRRVLSGKVEVQKMLMPVMVELSSRESQTLLDQQEVLAELGLIIEGFGGSTIALTGYPTLMSRADPQSLLRDLADQIESQGRKVERRDLIDALLHMMSCKAAIKAGQRLSFEEIESLLAQRHLCDDHHHCPHGRPTALKLTREELDRQFGRLGS
ncbi:DNA mismatch repair protein MutL [Thalassoglobus neptunius]|uniref:DNA mismatch repair protein MutL n=1 Tax=Thalassoglobus neptunius TaxID=1938619 RepID=A0A5C5X1J1_9PLAN|nr:DNA mismatch repair endonuclease MutL [Thalassoglobus neptunius]TWT56867.1 DNA mismatch repair protein MutL [Thalassoglobus neptunius]